jgi:signal transduction histidine kinase/uncharacterized membrane protein
MALQWTLLSVPPLVAATIALGLAAVAWRHRDRATGLPFFVLMVTIAGWSAFSAVRLATTSDVGQVVLHRIATLFAMFVPVVWLWLTARYAEFETLQGTRVLGLLSVEPVVFAVALLTNPLHGWIWREVVVASQSPRVLTFSPAIGHRLHLAYAYVLVLVGLGILVSVYRNASRVHRRQAGMLLTGAAVPLTVNVLINFGASPIPGFDLTPASFTVTGVIFALALFRYDLLDYTPVAYRNVTDVLGDGVIVLDPENHIREFNENAETILGTSLTVGDRLDDGLPGAATGVRSATEIRDESSGTAGGAADGGWARTDAVFEAEVDDQVRYFDVRISELPSRGGSTGRVVALRDVTSLQEHEQRLQVTNRVLRHNLRNEVNVIMGLADTLQERVDHGEEAIERIVDKAAALSELGDQARQIQQTMRRSEDALVPVDVVAVARDVVERYDDRAPTATVELTGPESALVMAADDETLSLPLANIVENAIEHHDREDPTVTVDVDVEGDTVEVHVSDDGPGIPASELAVLQEGRESQLQHGSGLGLWLSHWSVTGVGGEVDFAEREPRGTTVCLRFQRAS